MSMRPTDPALVLDQPGPFRKGMLRALLSRRCGASLLRVDAMMRLMLLCLVVLLSACDEARIEPPPYREGATVLTVKGMHCSDCKATILEALSKVDGVDWARAEIEVDQVAYTGDAMKAEVVAAIRDAGYEVIE